MSSPLPLDASTWLSSNAVARGRALIIDTIKTWGTGVLQDVRPHAGPLSVRGVREQAVPCPSIFVSVLRMRELGLSVSGGASVQLQVTWGLYVVTHGVIADRSELGLAICSELHRVVRFNGWGNEDETPFSRAPTEAESRTLYADTDEQVSHSIWGLTFEQAIDAETAGATPTPLYELLRIMGTLSTTTDPNATLEVIVE